MGAAPAPIFTPCHHSPPLPITWRCLPQYTMSGLSLRKTSPKGVCPLSDGRENSRNVPLIFRGNSTAFRLKGIKGFSSRVKVLKSFVFAMPMDAP